VSNTVEWIPNPLEEFEVKKQLDLTMRRRNGIAISDIQPSKNIGRLAQAIDPDHTDRLRACYQQGNPFYMPVLVENPDTKALAVANGDHRLDMCRKEGVTSIDAYVVVTDDKQKIFLLCNVLNALNGNPPTTAERVQGALAYMEEFKMSAQDAAAQFKVGASQVNSARAIEQGRNRAESLGVSANTTKKYSAAHWKQLNRLKQNDEVFAAAVRSFSHFDAAEAKTAIDKVLNQRNEAGQLDQVAKAVQKQAHVHRAPTAAPATSAAAAPAKGKTAAASREDKHLASRRKVSRAITALAEVLVAHDTAAKAGFTKRAEQQGIAQEAKMLRKLLTSFINSTES
jgi:hypothetical protein